MHTGYRYQYYSIRKLMANNLHVHTYIYIQLYLKLIVIVIVIVIVMRGLLS